MCEYMGVDGGRGGILPQLPGFLNRHLNYTEIYHIDIKKRYIHLSRIPKLFRFTAPLSVSGFFHGAQSQNIGLPNSCSAQLVRLGWLS
jgi:hypothetical protein